jgi:hypothetical protein
MLEARGLSERERMTGKIKVDLFVGNSVGNGKWK